MHRSRLDRHGDPHFVKQFQGDPIKRFYQKVNKNGPVPECQPSLGPCWIWQGANKDGYGQLRMGGRTGRLVQAHCFAYETFIAPISEGLTVDHLCRTPACVNPLHLEPVTNRVNILRGIGPTAENARKTHCKRGHEFSAENTYVRKGMRNCIACRRLFWKTYIRPSQTKVLP